MELTSSPILEIAAFVLSKHANQGVRLVAATTSDLIEFERWRGSEQPYWMRMPHKLRYNSLRGILVLKRKSKRLASIAVCSNKSRLVVKAAEFSSDLSRADKQLAIAMIDSYLDLAAIFSGLPKIQLQHVSPETAEIFTQLGYLGDVAVNNGYHSYYKRIARRNS